MACISEERIFPIMQIQLNGEPYELPDETTLAGLLAARGVNPLYTAVEVNRELVSRAQHSALVLRPTTASKSSRSSAGG